MPAVSKILIANCGDIAVGSSAPLRHWVTARSRCSVMTMQTPAMCNWSTKVLEAMKMEHPLKAGIDSVIKHIQVSLGDQVKNRQILLEVE